MSEPISVPLPARVQVSLRAGFVLAIANVVCVTIFSWAWMQVRAEPKQLAVTGSAKKKIESDLIVWRARISATGPDLKSAYAQLEDSVGRTQTYLSAHGIAAQTQTASPVETSRRFKRDEKGNPTDLISSFELQQTIEIRSTEVQKVAGIARSVTGLIKDGVMLDSEPPRYLYTKLGDLKVEMLADATRDATSRAQQIASNSNAQLGTILEARMGVMQINPVNVSDVSGTGNNDTTSFEKEITAVVSARFSLQ